MRPLGLLIVGLILLNILGFRPALGSGLRNFRGGWLLTPGDLDFILTDPVAGRGVLSDTVGHGVWAGAGQGLLYSMQELPLGRLECGVAGRGGSLSWSLAGSWERLGRELLVEDHASLSLKLGTHPAIAVQVNTHQWKVGSEKLEDDLGVTIAGWVPFKVKEEISGVLGLFLTPGGPPNWHGYRGRNPLLELKLLVPGSGLALRLDQRGDGVPLLRVEAMGRLAQGLGVGILADPETGSLGGNLAVKAGPLRLRTSHLVHPVLGVTHRFFVGMGDPRAAFP